MTKKAFWEKALGSIKALVCFEMLLVIILTLIIGIGRYLFPEIPFPPSKASVKSYADTSDINTLTINMPDKLEENSDRLPFPSDVSREDEIPIGSLAIVTENIPYKSKGEVSLKNETSYSPSIELLSSKSTLSRPESNRYESNSGPMVLIIHTHGTEAYSENNSYYFPEDELARSENIEENVVAVGKVIAQALEENSVPTLHIEKMHDRQSYLTSYNESAKTILECLDKYPSIEMVIDVHRDAIIYEDGTMVRTLCADGSAQLMLLVGSDENGANYPHWQDNLEMAIELQVALEAASPGITRPIDLRASSFNQQFSEKALLLEVGSCGNTLDEAKQAALTFANTLAAYIQGK